VEITATYQDLPDGTRIVVGQFRDVTEQRNLQSQLAQAQKMQALGTLVGGIAHDLNNILAPIVGYSEMGVEGLGSPDSSRDFFERILTSALRARDLVRRLLAFSRPGEGHRVRLDLSETTERALGMIREIVPASYALDLIRSPAPLPVLMDPVHLEQILMNLCTNAAQAMPGGGTIRIGLTALEEIPGADGAAEWAQLSVADEGIGMGDAVKSRIFDPFFTTRGTGEGTGLGLSVVHALVTSYGGSIDVESAPGKGTLFRIALPIRRPREPSPTRPVATEAPEKSGKRRVLVVEDEEMIACLYEGLLRSAGLEPETHTESLRALAAFLADPGRFDLLITDQVMPRLQGTELARRVRELRPDLPILFVSGWSEELRNAKTLFAPCEVLAKPVSRALLLATAKRHLGPA
jgi:nitrogen-specific signal transduction histidine kinase